MRHAGDASVCDAHRIARACSRSLLAQVRMIVRARAIAVAVWPGFSFRRVTRRCGPIDARQRSTMKSWRWAGRHRLRDRRSPASGLKPLPQQASRSRSRSLFVRTQPRHAVARCVVGGASAPTRAIRNAMCRERPRPPPCERMDRARHACSQPARPVRSGPSRPRLRPSRRNAARSPRTRARARRETRPRARSRARDPRRPRDRPAPPPHRLFPAPAAAAGGRP